MPRSEEIKQESPGLTQERIQKKLRLARVIALISTLTYSAILWSFITLKVLAQKTLEVVCFKIFAVIGFINAGLAIADAYTSPDQKIEKAADATAGLTQAILIGLGVFGTTIIAASITPYLFISAISLWIAHDTYKCIKNYWHYRQLCKHGHKKSSEAQTHLALTKIHGFSAIVGAVTLIGMIAMMGLVITLAANPITGPIVWAFSALFALYLTVKTISNTKWAQKKAKEWAETPPKIVIAYRKLDKALMIPVSEFIKNKAKSFQQALAKALSITSQTPSSAKAQESIAKVAPTSYHNTDTISLEQKQMKKTLTPLYSANRAEKIEIYSIECGYTFLINEIDEKRKVLHKEIYESKPNIFQTLFTSVTLRLDKLSFLENLMKYLINMKEKITSTSFEDFFRDQKALHPNLDTAYIGYSDVLDIIKAVNAWICKKEQEEQPKTVPLL